MEKLEYKIWDIKNKRWLDKQEAGVLSDGGMVLFSEELVKEQLPATNYQVVYRAGIRDRFSRDINIGDIVRVMIFNNERVCTVEFSWRIGMYFKSGGDEFMIDERQVIRKEGDNNEIEVIDCEVIANKICNPEFISLIK